MDLIAVATSTSTSTSPSTNQGPPGGGDLQMTYTAPSQPSGGDGLIDPGFHPELATIQDQAIKRCFS